MPDDHEDERFDRLLEALERAVDLCTRAERLQRLPEISRRCTQAAALAEEMLKA